MSAIDTVPISDAEVEKILSLVEGHFGDLKAIEIAPSKLTKCIAAFANAEGGELYVGIDEDKDSGSRVWRGFRNPEDANGHIQVFERLFPLGEDCSYIFLENQEQHGYVLKIDVKKTREVKKASDDKVYVRRGPQSLPVDTAEGLVRLRHNKGLSSFETEPVNAKPDLITNSVEIIGFMMEVVPLSEPDAWLRKQHVIIDDKPTVAGLILFADEPQAVLPKRCGVKIYRYRSKDEKGTRETLAFLPITIDGCAYQQIKEVVRKTAEIIEEVRINTPQGLEYVSYPIEALHELITNAVIHRVYSIADDIHIRIFDNRVEIVSPGTLPAHITRDNILDERFARNGVIVRLINKFPDPPNKDVGEGLNTAFEAMRAMRLKPPDIAQEGGNVKVTLKHESLATPEELILEFLNKHSQIRNREAREICYIGSENRMKTIFQRMMKRGLIELVPGTTRYTAAYRLIGTE